MGHLDALEGVANALLPFLRRHAAVRERELDVFVDGQVANQVERLEDETDLPILSAPEAADNFATCSLSEYWHLLECPGAYMKAASSCRTRTDRRWRCTHRD
jgi:hypothetical protein